MWRWLLCFLICASNAAKQCEVNSKICVQNCRGFEREISAGFKVCPIFNGVWSSFLDDRTWPFKSLARDKRMVGLVREMREEYDARGLNVWIGEDFDPRVPHHNHLIVKRDEPCPLSGHVAPV